MLYTVLVYKSNPPKTHGIEIRTIHTYINYTICVVSLRLKYCSLKVALPGGFHLLLVAEGVQTLRAVRAELSTMLFTLT